MEIACITVPRAVLAAFAEERRIPPEEVWEEELERLEAIGAALESERPGEAFFAVDGLLGIHGGRRSGGVEAARGAAELPVRIGVAPTRFAALVASRRGEIVPGTHLRDFLAPLPVATLTPRLGLGEREARDLAETMRRLGVATVGALSSLSS